VEIKSHSIEKNGYQQYATHTDAADHGPRYQAEHY